MSENIFLKANILLTKWSKHFNCESTLMWDLYQSYNGFKYYFADII